MDQEKKEKVLAAHLSWMGSGGLRGEKADFYGEDLSAVRLVRCDLDDANFQRANLEGADLAGASARRADFSGANLRGAVIQRANLTDANLENATLISTNMDGTILTGANLAGADIGHKIPVVENLDSKIAQLVAEEEGCLEMATWHSGCGSTHCRAGWAIVLAGEEGAALEEAVGSSAAGAFIYYASTGYVPDFFAGNFSAREDIRERALEEAKRKPATGA